MLLILDIVMVLFTAVTAVGTGFWLWEFGLNLKRVPPQKRPPFFQNDTLTAYELYSCWSLVIVPLFAFRFFDVLGWYSLFAYQVYPLACIVLAFAMFLLHKIFTSIYSGNTQAS